MAALAILDGQGLLKVFPMKWIIRVAAAVLVVLAVVSVTSVIPS